MRRARPYVAVLIILAAAATAPPTSAQDAPSILSQPLFVNMRDSGPYRLGRYVDGRPAPAGAVAESACGTWGPSAVRAHGRVYLYGAECTDPTPGTGWRRIVRYRSWDGGVTFSHRTVVATFPKNQIRMPTVVYDRGRFHLWYTQDRDGRIGQRLMYASSRDGLHFGSATEKFRAGKLNTISVSTVFRYPRGLWRMVIAGYSPDLRSARPYILRFRSPDQARYEYGAMMKVHRPTPKVDGSLVCRTADGWEGLFVLYGDPLGRERTMHFAAPALTGPWHLISDPEIPVLALRNGDDLMHSVENPTRLADSALLQRC